MSSARHESSSPDVVREAVVPLNRPRPAAPLPEFPGYVLEQAQAQAQHDQVARPGHQVTPVPPADRAFVGTLSAIASLLAARLLLLLAVIGAFVLAIRADGTPGLYVLISYCVLTVLPLVILDIVTRQRGGA